MAGKCIMCRRRRPGKRGASEWYADGYYDALTAMGGPARSTSDTIDCDDCGHPTDHGMAWGNAMLCPGCYDEHQARSRT